MDDGWLQHGYDMDAAQGRAIGSHIRMQGKMLGLTLSPDEIVIRHEPPAIKVWKTIGSPRLLIIGHYEMGYEVRPVASGGWPAAC